MNPGFSRNLLVWGAGALAVALKTAPMQKFNDKASSVSVVFNDRRTTIGQAADLVLAFRDARDWKQFHNPKDLAVAMAVEAAEVLELCRFKDNAEILESVQAGSREFAHELADVFSYLLTLADSLGIDLAEALQEKVKINEMHYPVELARGRKAKYTELAGQEDSGNS